MANLRGPELGRKMDPGAWNLYRQIVAIRRVAKIGGGVVAIPISPDITGQSSGVTGACLRSHSLSQKRNPHFAPIRGARHEVRNGSEAGNRLDSAPSRRNLHTKSNSGSNRLRVRRIVAIAPLDAAALSVSACAARFFEDRQFIGFAKTELNLGASQHFTLRPGNYLARIVVNSL